MPRPTTKPEVLSFLGFVNDRQSLGAGEPRPYTNPEGHTRTISRRFILQKRSVMLRKVFFTSIDD